MKRIGIIDNLGNIQSLLENDFYRCSASAVMECTGGNTGNVAFVFGARQIIKNPIMRIDWRWAPDEVRNQVDHLVVCCANQIGAHADLDEWADYLEGFSLPVTLLGLGAQSESYDDFPIVPEGTQRFLEVADHFRVNADHPNIGVRGQFTQSVLEDFGVSSVRTGCPSLMISGENEIGSRILARQKQPGYKKIAVAAGNPWHGPSAFLEKTLVNVVEKYSGAYILQHPVEMVQVAFGEKENITELVEARFMEVYDRANFEDLLLWYRRNANLFIDLHNWFRFLDKFDAVIGPRYHGIALALQRCVPGCVFTIDSRTRELCEETAVKSIPVDRLHGMSADEIVDVSQWDQNDAVTYDLNRHEKASIFEEFLRSNDIEPSDHLLALAGKSGS